MKNKIDIHFNWSTVAGSTEMHNEFKRQFTVTVPKHFKDAFVLPYDVGFVRAFTQPEICYQMGQQGCLDTLVIVPKATLWFDMKTGKAVLQPNQKAFIRTLKEIHGSDRGFKLSSIKQGLDIIKEFV